MYFTGSYLRVTTPVTTNGIIPKLNNGQQVFKETFLPLSAKKALEKKNARLTRKGFGHLISQIEVVSDGTPEKPKRKTK
jgi:hypothetical protein